VNWRARRREVEVDEQPIVRNVPVRPLDAAAQARAARFGGAGVAFKHPTGVQGSRHSEREDLQVETSRCASRSSLASSQSRDFVAVVIVVPRASLLWKLP